MQPSDKGGWVYLIVNPAWAGWVKVGKTTEPERRLRDYQTASPYRDYRTAAQAWFPDHHTAEKLLLKALDAEHEWARVDSYFAAQKLNELHTQLMEHE